MAFAVLAHIQDFGDTKAGADGWAGRISGEGAIEGFSVTCDAPGWGELVSFQAIQANGTPTAAVDAGTYCGTSGQETPLCGFVVHVAPGGRQFAKLYYEGVFQDGFRSGLLRPGARCVSPSLSPLRALRITTDPYAADGVPPAAEAGSRPEHLLAEPPHQGDIREEVSLVTHVAGIGDTAAGADGWGGRPEAANPIEGFSATYPSRAWSRDLTYRAVLADGSLGPPIQGGLYCGTRGKGQPLHGFLIALADGLTDLAGLAYQGVFEGGFRSRALSPGEICAAPDGKALVAMRITVARPTSDATPGDLPAPENIRLVIWDLDETFWGGTLTEGGIVWREENAQIVRELATRGIISSICSKNNRDDVLRVLEQHGMREHFVYSSINWDPKGPRLAALIKDVQLRAPSVLFIDDNPLNRAEAAQFVPGLQVQGEQCLPGLLTSPRLQGKPDPGLTRLEQYRLLERRHADRARVDGNTAEFLRGSNISVRIDYEIKPHIYRAVELINRTNQLNFTKTRLPDDPDNPSAARDALLSLLAKHEIQAGLVHVRDRYGDYGFCGFYVIRRYASGEPILLHFAFSCRILGMGVETWLYRALDRPRLHVNGKVVSDPAGDDRVIDWINAASAETRPCAEQATTLSYVMLRGACDLRPLAHYFAMATGRVIEEVDTFRRGQRPLLNHSVIAAQALRGVDPRAIADAALLGYDPDDFAPFLAGPVPDGPALWVFGFAIEQHIPLFRHKGTGTIVPLMPAGLTGNPAAMMQGGDCENVDPALVAHLRAKFDLVSRHPKTEIDSIFRGSLQTIFSRAGADVAIYVVLANEHFLDATGNRCVAGVVRDYNTIVADVASNFANVELLAPLDFMTEDEFATITEIHHFDRMVYFRIFQHIMKRQSVK